MPRTLAVLRRLSVLTVGEGAARLLAVVVFAALARSLGVAALGVFSFAMSLALVLENAMDLGQNARLGKLTAEDPEAGAAHYPIAAGNKVAIGVVITLAAAAVARLAGTGTDETAVIVLLLVWAVGLSLLDSLRSAARSLGRFNVDSFTNGAESFGRLLGVLSVWALGGGLVWFGVAFALESWLAVAVAWTWLARAHPALGPAMPSRVDMARFLAAAAPFGFASLCLRAFYNLDQVLVRTISGAAANGLYGAAARVAFAASVIGGLLALVVFPDLSRIAADTAAFRRYLSRAAGLALAIGVVGGGLVFFTARPVLGLLYGSPFLPAAPMLQVLAVMVLFRGCSTVGLYAANAFGRERQALVVAAVFAVVSIGADLVLLPRFGAMAAAWVSAAGEVGLSASLLMVCFADLGIRRDARADSQAA